MRRPWATGLERLLRDRRLKKGDLAALAGVRPATVSAVANSPASPDVQTLQRLADGFTKYDRQQHPHAPAVALWEFFVSDEQAALLQQATQSQQRLVRQEDLAALVIQKLAPAVASAIQDVTSSSALGLPASEQAAPKVSAPHEEAHQQPTEHPARGRLQRRRPA